MRAMFPVTGLLLFLALLAPAVAQTDPAVEARIARITGNIAPAVVLKGRPGSGVTLEARMKALNVPGVSVAVIRNGKIEWARGFGVKSIGGAPVTTETLFQAGSISKPVAALALLHLVQSGQVDLDTDVNRYLKSWKVPENEFTREKKVTLRTLLTHTGGLTVHGFPGYASTETVPTLVQVLDGAKPANTAAIRVDTVPGTNWRYSGGGYTIAQQLLIDVTGKSFPAYLQETVLEPLGMTHSTYEQPLPAARRGEAATPYNNGAVAGGPHVYPEMAAAGLWTTATDLARYGIGVQQALAGRSERVISKATAAAMLKPGGLENWGLGPQLGGKPGHPYFQHGGVDEGFIAQLTVYNNGDGVAVMTNSMGGGQLGEELVRTIALEYGWPDFAPVQRAAVSIDSKLVDSYAGAYRTGRYRVLTLARKDDHLAGKQGAQDFGELYPSSAREWFLTRDPSQLTFHVAANGAVTGLVQQVRDSRMPAPRITAAEAQQIADELAAKLKHKTPDPRAEAALRRNIEDLRAGKPDYARMSPGLADATREQLKDLQAMMAGYGAIKGIAFKDVVPNGSDVYEVTFEKGRAEFRILLDAEGGYEGIGLRPLAPAG